MTTIELPCGLKVLAATRDDGATLPLYIHVLEIIGPATYASLAYPLVSSSEIGFDITGLATVQDNSLLWNGNWLHTYHLDGPDGSNTAQGITGLFLALHVANDTTGAITVRFPRSNP